MACKGTDIVPVLNVVKYDDGVARCMLKMPSFVSNLENTVVPLNLWGISSRVGAL